MKKKETTQNEEVTLSEENIIPTTENSSNKEEIPPQKMGQGKIIGGALVGGTVVATISQAFISHKEIAPPNPQAENIRPVPVEEIETIDTAATLATSVEEDMTFNEAFATARQELGPGGVFEWEGNIYNTYYKEEYDAMSDTQRTDYMAEAMNHAPEQITPTPPQDNNTGIEEAIAETETPNPPTEEAIAPSENEAIEDNAVAGIVVDEPQTETEETVVAEIIDEEETPIITTETEETVVAEIIDEEETPIITTETEETVVAEIIGEEEEELIAVSTDLDGDGQEESVAYVTPEGGVSRIESDFNHNTVVDSVMHDTTDDGIPDTIHIDMDEDGKVDIVEELPKPVEAEEAIFVDNTSSHLSEDDIADFDNDADISEFV